MVLVNKKDFVIPAPAGGMSSAERKYFVMGNLAAAYARGQDKRNAYVSGRTVMLGDQPIITTTEDDRPAKELAALLNRIK